MKPNVIERIKNALQNIPNADFAKVIEQRAKTIVNVNSPYPIKVRRILASPDFGNVIGAIVTPLRKTMATGFTVYVDAPDYGKPLFLRIRRGGLLAPGIGNERGLVANVDSAIQNGIQNIVFTDTLGGSIAIRNAVAVRQVGNEVGSRTGNRGDVEITDADGVAHRISVKKENATKVAGLTRFLERNRKRIQRALRDFLLENDMTVLASGLISVQIKNQKLFNFCWFGNDIDVNGGVVVGNFDNNACFTRSGNGETLNVRCLRAFSPGNTNRLINGDLTSIYLLMRVDKRYHMEFLGAYNRKMAGRYEVRGFEVDGITNDTPGGIIDENEPWIVVEND